MTASKPSHEWVPTRAGTEIHIVVRYPEVATSPGVVVIHGLASNARMWDGVASVLSERGHPVAAVDLRGHGRSGKPLPSSNVASQDTAYGFPVMCLDIDQVMAYLSERDPGAWHRPIVVGQSYGANVALELGATRPWAFSGVVCVDGGTIELSESFSDWASCLDFLMPPSFPSTSPEDLENLVRSTHPDWPESGIQGMLANFIVNAQGYVEPCLSLDRHITVLYHLFEHRPSALYPTMSVPVLLIPAEGSNGHHPDWRKQGAESALERIPRVELQWIRGDHDLHAQHPAQVATLIHERASSRFFA